MTNTFHNAGAAERSVAAAQTIDVQKKARQYAPDVILRAGPIVNTAETRSMTYGRIDARAQALKHRPEKLVAGLNPAIPVFG
jgi:hypothetical protein